MGAFILVPIIGALALIIACCAPLFFKAKGKRSTKELQENLQRQGFVCEKFFGLSDGRAIVFDGKNKRFAVQTKAFGTNAQIFPFSELVGYKGVQTSASGGQLRLQFDNLMEPEIVVRVADLEKLKQITATFAVVLNNE